MLTVRILAAIRAALLFWGEEMAVHDPEIARPYWDGADFDPLSVAEIETLRQQLTSVHYVACDPASGVLISTQLFTASDSSSAALATGTWAAVILPPK